MIAELVTVLLGAAIGGSGPAWHDWRARIRARRDFPAARVEYLPSGECLPDPAAGRCLEPECALCKARAKTP